MWILLAFPDFYGCVLLCLEKRPQNVPSKWVKPTKTSSRSMLTLPQPSKSNLNQLRIRNYQECEETLEYYPHRYKRYSFSPQLPPTYQSMGEAYVDDPRLSPMMVQMETHDGHYDSSLKRRREARRQRRNEEKPDEHSGESRPLTDNDQAASR